MSKAIKRKDVVFVTVQGILFLLYAFPITAGPNFPNIGENYYWVFALLALLGLILVVLSLFQLGSTLSPFPTPKPHGKLETHGAFRYVRHPIYSGILLSAYAISFLTDCWFRLAIAILLHVLFFFKARYEEGMLLDRFDDYTGYMKSTGRFLPKFRSSEEPS